MPRSIYKLPEFIVLPTKLKRYCLWTIIDGREHSETCRLLKINPDRTKKDPRVALVKAAWRTPEAPAEIVIPTRFPAGGPETVARAFYEAARRLERDATGHLPAGDPEDPTLTATTIIRHADGDIPVARWIPDSQWEAAANV